MAQPLENSTLPEAPLETSLNRRELLKALAAGSGAMAACTILPAQWVKPVIEVGVLPAHAQASPAPTQEPTEYTIACTADPTSGNTTFVDDITATVSATNGAAVDNIEVQYIAESVPPGTQTSPVTGFTNGAGVVNLGTFAYCQSQLPDGDYRIVISFVDQANFGADTCVLGIYSQQGC